MRNLINKLCLICKNEVVFMKKYKVGIIGATGMVGQRFATLLADHPWFEVKVVAASPRSAGLTYKQAVEKKWAMTTPIRRSPRFPISGAAIWYSSIPFPTAI